LEVAIAALSLAVKLSEKLVVLLKTVVSLKYPD